MILRPAVIDTRLRYLRQVVRNLEIVRAVPREQYVSSFQWYWLGERGLQLAAETVFDVGTHILSGHFNESPADLFLQQKLDVFLGFADDVEAFLKQESRR